MNFQEWEEVVSCLPNDRTLFSYFKDQYAVYLLERQIERGHNKIAELRRSCWKKLLDKPLIKGILSECGDGTLRMEHLWGVGLPDASRYVLTLGRWGDRYSYPWGQTSRPGVNLVLQLNMPNYIDRDFQTLVGSPVNDVVPYSHPYSNKRPVTLAWARIDFDFTTNELLIEEIQSDLIRILDRLKRRALLSAQRTGDICQWGDKTINPYAVAHYCDQLLNGQKKLWAEAMLAAALWFAQKELGFGRVYYHTYETSVVMKNIRGAGPPRSLYTDLPEQFCFVRTDSGPEFILADRQARRSYKKMQKAEWYLIN